jgi:hypothetical protein
MALVEGLSVINTAKIIGIVLVVFALFLTLGTKLVLKLFRVKPEKQPKAALAVKLGALGLMLLGLLFFFQVIAF